MANVWQLVGKCIDHEGDLVDFIQYQIRNNDSSRPDFVKAEQDKKVLKYDFKHLKKIRTIKQLNALHEIGLLKEEVLRKRNLTSLELAAWPADQTQGHVYFLLADNGMVKIGKAKSVDKRLKQVKPKMPYDLEIVHKIKSDKPLKLESVFHSFFEKHRKKGEWFDLNKNDLRKISQIDSYFDFSDYDKGEIVADLVPVIGRPRR